MTNDGTTGDDDVAQLYADATNAPGLGAPRFEAVEAKYGPSGVRMRRTELAGEQRQHTDLVATCPDSPAGDRFARLIVALLNAHARQARIPTT